MPGNSKIKTSLNPPPYWTQLIFWMATLAFGFYIKPASWEFWPTILWTFGNTFVFFIAVNVNLYILLPLFMFKQSLLSYLAVLLAFTILLTPFLTLFNIWFVSEQSSYSPKWLSLPHFHFINLLIITALSSLIRIPLDWLKMQSEKNELLTKNIETELQSLKNQINPHFLFNTLNNLYALTLKKSEQAPEVVLKLSDMMRYMLYECNEKEVSLEKEFRYIQNYIELERLRYTSGTEINLHIDEKLLEKQIAPLLLIPFVENSFKHGSQLSLTNSFINIHAELIEDDMLFLVLNSKPPIIPGQNQQKKPGGVGLVNVKKRLELLYTNRYSLTLEDNPESFSIKLRLQLNTVQNDKNTDN